MQPHEQNKNSPLAKVYIELSVEQNNIHDFMDLWHEYIDSLIEFAACDKAEIHLPSQVAGVRELNRW